LWAQRLPGGAEFHRETAQGHEAGVEGGDVIRLSIGIQSWVRLNFCGAFRRSAGDAPEEGRYRPHHTSAASASSAD
jgi:hypothetical protein